MIQKNTTLIYILAIVAFACCCWFGGIGVIPAAIAYFMAKKTQEDASLNPENYAKPGSFGTAKTIALISLIINVLYMAYTIYQISTVGWDEMMEQSRMQMEQMGIEQ